MGEKTGGTHKEKGSVMILVMLSLTVILGFAALALDGGYLYSRHMRLQDISDAVALSSGAKLGETNGNNVENKKRAAFQEAVAFAPRNGVTINSSNNTTYIAQISYGDEQGQMIVTFPDGINKVKVDINLDANLFFAKVLGMSSTPVAVSSTVLIGSASQQNGGLVPIGIVTQDLLNPGSEYVTGQYYDMTLGPGSGSSGNFGWLNFQPSSYFNDYLEHGYDQTINVGDVLDTYTGVSLGLAAQAIEDRIGTDSCTLSNYQSHEDCPRLIYTPIVERYGESGVDQLEVLGFASFFLETYVHDGSSITLRGQFVGTVSAADIAPSNFNYSTHAVKLID